MSAGYQAIPKIDPRLFGPWNAHHPTRIKDVRRHVDAMERALERANATIEQKNKAIETLARIEKRIGEISSELVQLFPELMEARAMLCGLSPTELRVYAGVCTNRGFPGKLIAESLGMSHRTFKFHIVNILKKTKMKSMREF